MRIAESKSQKALMFFFLIPNPSISATTAAHNVNTGAPLIVTQLCYSFFSTMVPSMTQ